MALVVDTGPLLAAGDPDDADHPACQHLLDRIEPLTAQDYARIRVLLRHYADLPLGLVDASVVAICERLGERKVATLDHRHFRAVRPAHTASLRLLPDA